MSVESFALGQRWISSTEAELGLGIVSGVEGRRVTLSFPSAAESRTYATDNAPLSRFAHVPGEMLSTADDRRLSVVELKAREGRIIYVATDANGDHAEIDELALSSAISLRTPEERLFAGQIDKSGLFDLRTRTLEHMQRLQSSPVRGLLGPRIQLLPHQLYIANEIGTRYAPRVLLADEVGLGKTIESGLVIHQQLVTGRASRVLVAVPDHLVHQWLVEMLRRFNLAFTLMDRERYDALFEAAFASELEDDTTAASGDGDVDNPFMTSQLVLCSLSLLTEDPVVHSQACDAGFDLLVVDEAHHLQWAPGAPSEAYAAVEALASEIEGVLLLTGTPEQLGVEGHFARLRLLDPARYFSLEHFVQEEQGFEPVGELVQALLHDDAGEQLEALAPRVAQFLGDDAASAIVAAAGAKKSRPALDDAAGKLLDRHGTGRVLFRNTRRALGGFPQRRLHRHALDAPPGVDWRQLALETVVQPERQLGADWLDSDPRVAWLVGWLARHRDDKVLIICARRETAIELEQHLRLREGVRCAAFHEDLALIARDRAAAYFADPEENAQALVCSEIGSEGRNFQFASELVLFDLPLDPDLLEQRIGRLDRIGQARDVNIHVPVYADTAQDQWLRWLHEGANAVERSAPAAARLWQDSRPAFEAALDDDTAMARCIATAAAQTAEAERLLDDGRHRLIELNSYREGPAQDVRLRVADAASPDALEQYVTEVADHFGIDTEVHSAHTLILRPGDHMRVPNFPGLPEDGVTATWSRSKALSREDVEFLSWEHPLVTGAMDLVAHGGYGNTALCSLELKALEPGTLLVECLFSLNCAAPKVLQVERFVGGVGVRTLFDIKQRDLAAVLTADRIRTMARRVPRHAAQAIVRRAAPQLKALILHSTRHAEQQRDALVAQAMEKMRQEQRAAISRLADLAAVNPAIRAEEVEHEELMERVLAKHLAESTLALDALRIAIAAPKAG